MPWSFRLKLPQITAVSIETAFQNGGIAFILLKVSLGAPYGDLASVAPVAQLMITGDDYFLFHCAIVGASYLTFSIAGTPLWALLGVWKLWSKCIQPRLFPKELPVEKEEQDLTAEQKPLQNTPTDLA